jgi:hypothetical protein
MLEVVSATYLSEVFLREALRNDGANVSPQSVREDATMNKIHPEDLPEVITTLYLRLNGCFTSGLVLHSEVKA